MRLPAQLPASPGNLVADDDRAAQLGFELFFDARLSRNSDVRCASCHAPERLFHDGRARSVGLEPVTRNSPSVFTAPWLHWMMWDGKADSLWSQPLLALENPKEMDFTRLELAHRVALSYRARYEAIFGALPPLDDAQRFPARGRPGLPEWDSMSEVDRQAIDLVAANVGKSIEAYERKLAMRAGRFDRWLDGEAAALEPLEREGAVAFFDARCVDCHSGPMLTDERFHALGWAPLDGVVDRGRAAGLEVLAASPFSLAGSFNDGPKQAVPTPTGDDEGAFRTAPLRNVTRTGPWGHDGRFDTLEAVVDSHLPAGVTERQRAALLAFLAALEGTDPPSPWNGWPNR